MMQHGFINPGMPLGGRGYGPAGGGKISKKGFSGVGAFIHLRNERPSVGFQFKGQRAVYVHSRPVGAKTYRGFIRMGENWKVGYLGGVTKHPRKFMSVHASLAPGKGKYQFHKTFKTALKSFLPRHAARAIGPKMGRKMGGGSVRVKGHVSRKGGKMVRVKSFTRKRGRR